MSKVVITIDVPDGVKVDVDYVADEPPHPAAHAPTAPRTAQDGPSCQHGAMYHKSGTNKQNKPYSGWFCSADVCPPKWDPR